MLTIINFLQLTAFYQLSFFKGYTYFWIYMWVPWTNQKLEFYIILESDIFEIYYFIIILKPKVKLR